MAEQKTLASGAIVFRLMEQGQLPNYTFVVDRSTKGLEFLEQLKSRPAGMFDAGKANDPVLLWEASPHPYFLAWGRWGSEAGFTIQVSSIESLLTMALPKAMERTLKMGGLCAFVAAVDDKVRPVIERRNAELQPVAGPNGVAQ
ncbi:hypothetical protein [Rhodoferax sp.]|uniref:hypothetical protein n=1 Tax=Rhodoferax sp. TaxID=50421 RepID=UPI00275A996F|nr:hypothetical protein [Rhodoferax sp.]